ncbi:MAG: hypothetical protein WKG07_06645 [Hymenobacter sp.]
MVVIGAERALMKSISEGQTGEDYDGDGIPGGNIITVSSAMPPPTSCCKQAGVARASALHHGPAQRRRQRVRGPLGPRPQPAPENHRPRLPQNLRERLLSAGADSVVMPDEIGGSHMANLVVRPEVIRFLDLISGLSADKLRLEELSVRAAAPGYAGARASASWTCARAPAPPSSACAGRRHADGEPVGRLRAGPGDVLLVLGSEAQIETSRCGTGSCSVARRTVKLPSLPRRDVEASASTGVVRALNDTLNDSVAASRSNALNHPRLAAG